MDSQFNDNAQLLDKYISPTVRKNIDQQFYAKINSNARLSFALKDPLFHQHPLQHISLTTDHGVIHARDVAIRTLQLLEQLNGIHFAKRPAARLEFMKGYGAMLAYLHDIGMIKVTSTERDIHAAVSAQLLYSDFFDQQLVKLWEENSGNVAWRITQLAYRKIFNQPPKIILREILTLCGAHTRETLSTEMLNHPGELRKEIQQLIAYQPEYQWLQAQVVAAEKSLLAAQRLENTQRERFLAKKQQAENALAQAIAEHQTSEEINKFLSVYYENFWQDSFNWLITDNAEAREFVDDIIDTLRTLRAANASRQRGAKLRATGGHQIFLDHYSANAIYAINAEEKLFLLESPNNLLAGEVNLSSTEFTPHGDLRISFYRGRFANDATTEKAIFNAAIAINELQADMIGSFDRPAAGHDNSSADYVKKWHSVYILLENCDDNSQFATRVKQQLILINPSLKETILIVPSLQNASEIERNRYLMAEELGWDLATAQTMLAKIANSGHKITGMQADHAFTHVKRAKIAAGETLLQAGTLASFVYIPLDEGLIGYPLGGYDPFHAKPFIPIGEVGVIRADTRNAQVIAEKNVEVLMVPREVYLQYWHTTYTAEELVPLIVPQNKKIAENHH